MGELTDERLASPELPTDEVLLERARSGDEAAFAELYRRHAELVRRYARLCCRDRVTADDLTAEVFARTLRIIRQGGGPRASMRGYLLTMIRREAAMWRTGRLREWPVAEPVPVPGDVWLTPPPAPETQAMRQADRSMVIRAFRSLPERWQTVLWHATVEAQPLQQVAATLGLTVNATSVLAFRAREGLRAAYLQAHVNESIAAGREECRRYASQLGTFTRKRKRRAFRQLREHLDDCERCRDASLELAELDTTLHGLLPVAFLGMPTAGGLAEATGTMTGFAGPASAGTLGKVAVTVALAAGVVAASPEVTQAPAEQRPAATVAEAAPAATPASRQTGTGEEKEEEQGSQANQRSQRAQENRENRGNEHNKGKGNHGAGNQGNPGTGNHGNRNHGNGNGNGNQGNKKQGDGNQGNAGNQGQRTGTGREDEADPAPAREQPDQPHQPEQPEQPEQARRGNDAPHSDGTGAQSGAQSGARGHGPHRQG